MRNIFHYFQSGGTSVQRREGVTAYKVFRYLPEEQVWGPLSLQPEQAPWYQTYTVGLHAYPHAGSAFSAFVTPGQAHDYTQRFYNQFTCGIFEVVAPEFLCHPHTMPEPEGCTEGDMQHYWSLYHQYVEQLEQGQTLDACLPILTTPYPEPVPPGTILLPSFTMARAIQIIVWPML